MYYFTVIQKSFKKTREKKSDKKYSIVMIWFVFIIRDLSIRKEQQKRKDKKKESTTTLLSKGQLKQTL